MRPREIPLLLCAVGVPLWIGAASLPLPETCAEVLPPVSPSDWRPLAGLALLGVVARVRTQASVLLACVGEDRPVAGTETYRGSATYRALSAGVANDWKRRSRVAGAATVLTTAVSWTAQPGAWGMIALSCAMLGGAAVFLQHRRGHASLLYLPLLAALLLSLGPRAALSSRCSCCFSPGSRGSPRGAGLLWGATSSTIAGFATCIGPAAGSVRPWCGSGSVGRSSSA